MTVNVGDTIRINAQLLVGDVPTDPNTLRLDITDPAMTVTTYLWTIDPEIVRDAVGAFHFDLFVTQPGTWTYQWFSNGSLTAFDEGPVTTTQSFALQVLDDQTTPAPVPFASVEVRDEATNVLQTLETDENGEATLTIEPGTYQFWATKLGWFIPTVQADLVTPGGGPAPDVVIYGTTLDGRWLGVRDLEAAIQIEAVDRLFHDDNSGKRDAELLQSSISQAEALAESKLLRNWALEDIPDLAFQDPAVRLHAAFIALELATERRTEFIGADGKGRFWVQYERAVDYFDSLGKSKDLSRSTRAKKKLGRNPPGRGTNVGGKRKPSPTANNWVFSDEADGRKHGGF